MRIAIPRTLLLAALALACAVTACESAMAGRRPTCVEVRDPGVGFYRIRAPARRLR